MDSDLNPTNKFAKGKSHAMIHEEYKRSNCVNALLLEGLSRDFLSCDCTDYWFKIPQYAIND